MRLERRIKSDERHRQLVKFESSNERAVPPKFLILLGGLLGFLGCLSIFFFSVGFTYAPNAYAFPAIMATPGSGPFGNVPVNTESSPITFTWDQSGTSPVISITGTNSGDFIIKSSSNPCIYTIGLFQCTASIAFKPSSAGAKFANLNTGDGQSAVLTGTGIAPTTTAVPATGSLNGIVFVDGNPAPGFTVNLEGRETKGTVTGADGAYHFTGLPSGTYKIRVAYDKQKYTVVGQDYSDQTLARADQNNINFNFNSVATTTAAAPVTTTVTVTPTTTAAPLTTTAAPVTTTTAAPSQVASCPGVSSNSANLAIGYNSIKSGPTTVSMCIRVAAGTLGVDLSKTVILNLPGGVSIVDIKTSTGLVSGQGSSTLSWSGFSLSPRQSADIALTLEVGNQSSINGKLTLSGQFSQGQAFNQTYDLVLPGSNTVEVQAVTGQGGGGGAPAGGSGGATNVQPPKAAPNAGQGHLSTAADLSLVVVLGMVALCASGLVLVLYRRYRPAKRD